MPGTTTLHPGASTPRQEKRRAPPAKVASQVMYKHCASIQYFFDTTRVFLEEFFLSDPNI